MEKQFREALKLLNQPQRQAVEAVEGPVLVIAGPGTGKTQLLSTRAANILKQTDAGPGNILCLTFTDNAARNMRERVIQIIGRPAYHVAIHTFHSFGADIINRYPDYFAGRQMLQQIDELGRYELLSDIFEGLPYSNPLSTKAGDRFVFIDDALEIIGWLKQNALTPDELHKVLIHNKRAIDALAKPLAGTLTESPLAKYLPKYRRLLQKIQSRAETKRLFGYPDFATECAAGLAAAIADSDTNGRYAAKVTEWRNRWCQKNAGGRYVFKDGGRNYRKMQALANVYQQLLDRMTEQGLFDFDDMVMEAVQAIENQPELRFSLQERYQYILVDEFQDTNKAQLRMLQALGDNPVYEGKPNIMAVGDDDQAVYAFQGAEASNMAAFIDIYKVQPIVLRDNYRSDTSILQASRGVAIQISDRLEAIVPHVAKELTARQKYASSTLDHLTFASELAQYSWICREITRLIKNGLAPEQIAVIAPRHRYLERLMPYLGQQRVPVAYERRENILEAPVIAELLSMAELVVAIAENRQGDADALFSQVLGYDFWGFTTVNLVNLSLECYQQRRHWLDALIHHTDQQFRDIAAWFVDPARRSRLEPLEYMLDRLIGGAVSGSDSEFDEVELPGSAKPAFVSPFREYYFSLGRYESSTESYLTLLGQLSTLRHHLRRWKPSQTLRIKDLTDFVQLNLAAGIQIVDTNPHTQTTKAVQVMTAYKAKGLEFEAVFLINVQDEIWGPTARSHTSRISLPHNLTIEPAGNSDNDKLRLLYVAMTRAKRILHICGYSHDLENRLSPSLSFIDGLAGLESRTIDKPTSVRAAAILSADWSYRFRQIIADKPALMEPILDDYKLSVTHLNNFIDVAGAGPQYFLVHNLLRFPEAMSPSAAYGDAVHTVMKWLYEEMRQSGSLPGAAVIQRYFSDTLRRKHLRKTDQTRLDKRGRKAITKYIRERAGLIVAADLAERSFGNEGVVIGTARLSGKIDVIHPRSAGSAEVIDFKTGKPARGWQGRDEFEKIKLHKYRQQLLFYKLLVENSASYQKRLTVLSGRLEFIEADERNRLLPGLELEYDPHELEEFVRLINAVWGRIMALDFPDTSHYPATLKGIRQFEADLVEPLKNPPL